MYVEQEYFVGYRDVNLNKELTNTSLLAFLENTAGKHSSKIGNCFPDNHTWMLLAWKVNVYKRPRFNDVIRVKTWSRKIEKFYAFRDFEVYNKENEVIARASSKWIYLDIERGKIVKVPEEVASLYDSENLYTFDEENREFSKLVEPENHTENIEINVTRSMIDTNLHLHNIYYLDMAKEVLPEKVYLENEFSNFEIMYKKEVKYGEKPKAYYVQEGNKHIVTIKSNDGKEVHTIIVMK